MHRYPLRVRYGDTDQMGFAYYANYFRWFEIGRSELFRSLGTTYREVEESGIILPVVEATCRYLKSTFYDDRIAIETTVTRLGRATVRFEYRLVREEDGALLATGHTEHCFLGEGNRRVGAPAAIHALLERALEAPAGEAR